MSNKKCTVYPANTQINKTSDTLDMKGDTRALRNPEVDDLVKVGGPHTVVSTLLTEVGSLGSANHIHVQLFDGQVIQITSAHLEETEAQIKECEAIMKESENPIVTGDLGSGEGTVTLLTSNGKTYILPQPLNSAEDGRYIISNEVLSTERVLHDGDLPQEKQILAIPPPPPPPPPSQSALNFSSSVGSHLDALAIATSEVFSEDYESVPLKTQDPVGEQSDICRFKNPDTKSTQQINDKDYTHARDDYPRSSVLPDARIITITASDKSSEERVEQRPCCTDKGTLKKNYTSVLPKPKEINDLSVPGSKATEKNCSKVGQIQLDSRSCSPTCSKWVSGQDSLSKELIVVRGAPKVSAVKERAKMIDVVCTKVVTEEKKMDKTNIQITDSENIQDGSLKPDVQDKTKLRRSLRIRKVKTNKVESDLADGAGTCKKRNEMKWEPSSALWECGSCDAMFRKDFPSYESYKQHMEETHSTAAGTSMSTSAVTSMATTTKTTTATHTSSLVASADIKLEMETEPRLEDEAEKEESQGRLSTKEKNSSINTNLKDFHSHGERSCPYCSKTFRRRSRFLRHLNYHQGKRTYMCRICTKCFVEKSGLRAHLLTHCPINKECPQCGKLFKTERTMTRHLRTHLNLTYTCEICSKQFRHEESLRVHKSVHKEGGSGNICTICEKDCKTPHYLQLHMTTKHEAAKFTCQQCDRSFKWKQSFRKHMATHHDDSCLKFKCSLCPRHFMTSSELRLHQVVHSSEKKHLCDICGKAFKHEYTRDKHTKTVHREDREHMCPQCGALFKAKAYLDQHLAHVHTTKERVVCRFCGRDFKTEANLRSHIKVVHKLQNPKYTCKTCHKMFLAPKDLLRHSKIHTGIKDYMCPKCHRCFSRKDNMTAHLRTHTTSQNSPDSPAEPDIVVPGVVMSQNSCHAGGSSELPSELPHVISLTSSDSSNLPSPTSNIALPTVSTSSANIVLSKICPANSIVVLSGESPSETSPTSSDITPVSETPITGCRASPTNLPVSSVPDIPNMPSFSTGSVILSTVPVSSICNSIVSTPSTPRIVSSGTQSNRLAHCSPSSLSHSNTSPPECSLNAVSSSTPSNSVPASETPTDHQTYNFHPHLVVSSAHHGSNIPTLLAASPVPSTIISLPPPHSTSPVLVSQDSRTPMVCSTFQGEQVVLTAGPLTPISKVSIHEDGPPQYTQLDPLSTSISSTPTTSMNVTISPLNHSASSAARNFNVTLGTDEPLSTDSAPHAPSVYGIVPGTILPSSSFLQEAALILPEKKMDPLSFYGSRIEDSSDEDSTLSNGSDSSTSEEIDEAEETESDGVDESGEKEDDRADEAGETDDDDDYASASTYVPAQGWGPVSSKHRLHAFSGKEELVIFPQVNSLTGKPEPIDMYELFITDALLDTIVSQTNTYAQQKINAAPLTRRARLTSWKPTTRSEMKKFIGIILYMGIVGMPEISSYWSKNKLYAGCYISSVMTRERFEILLSCIHFRDNSDVDDPHDPLFKLRPFITAIRDRCQAVYKPGPMFVVDESMVPFRGRTKIRQYLPGKSHKYGFKLYKVCTPSGYVWNFKIHSGSQTKRQGLNSTESLTIELCEELLDQGATLYADNFCCSLTLAEYLLDKKTYLCGTLNSTRKNLPKEVTECKLRKNEMKGLENSKGVKVFKWRDKRNVLTISTLSEHSDQLVPSGKVNRCKGEVFKPESVMAYNKAKKGVDVSDQYTSYYSPLRKSKKWYRKLAFELITGLTVVNAWVLHCQYFPMAKMSQLQFREALMCSLIGDEPENIRPGKSPGVISGKRNLHTLTEKDGPK